MYKTTFAPLIIPKPTYVLDLTFRFPSSDAVSMPWLLAFKCNLTRSLAQLFRADEILLHRFEPIARHRSKRIYGIVIDARIVAASFCFPCVNSLDTLYCDLQVLLSTLFAGKSIYLDACAVDLLPSSQTLCCN